MRFNFSDAKPIGIIMMVLMWISCGQKKTSSDQVSPFTATMEIPNYQDNTQGNYAADLAKLTEATIKVQDVGAKLASYWASKGKITLDDNQVVQLTNIAKDDCPEGVSYCADTDSKILGVGPNALVESLDKLASNIPNQGERGTCVAFAVNSALEIMVRRMGTEVNLSEQFTYLKGKEITNDWETSGLSLTTTIKNFGDQKVHLAPEESWVYNQKSTCDIYKKENPNMTCSDTEAQGGGADFHGADAKAIASAKYYIKKSHKLYASLGRIKQALYRGYPVVAGVNANADFSVAQNPYKKGVISWVFKQSSCEGVCGHAVLIVGYQDDISVHGGGYLIIKNSWGSSWGYYGLAMATYEWVQKSLLDAVAITEIGNE